MTLESTLSLFKEHGLKETESRRMVVQTLLDAGVPLSATDIHTRMEETGAVSNLVTVYRILETLRHHHIVHRHPSGLFFVCSLPGTKGHHGYLHCHSCGKIEEFSDSKLCAIENDIATKANFRPTHHMSEISGTCAQCQ